jgi:MFS family permease
MHGLYLLWWVQEKQLSPVLVGSVLAAGDLALMILELPTGWFADRCGHRASLIVGSLVQTAGMLCCWLGAGVPGLLAASVLVAVGDAFRSGADQALLYRTCVAVDREDDFQKITARARTAQLVALVALVLVGGIVVHTWGFAAGWIAETALAVLGLGFACAMAEPPAVVETAQHSAVVQRAPILSLAMAMLILPASLVGAQASAASFLVQTDITARAGTMTVLVAIITLSEAAGSAVASRLPVLRINIQPLLALATSTLSVVMLVSSGTSHVVTLALSFVVGLAEPLRDAAVQRLARDEVRARAASLASACDKAFMTAALPLAGVWRRRH